MSDNDIKKMLDTVYTIELRGSVLGYVLTVLAAEQDRLNKKSQNDITDIGAVMAAAANDMVGNDMLHAVYKAAGEEFLGFTMGMKPEVMKTVMESDSIETIKGEVERARKERRTNNKNLH
jgi:hypothetical protein